MKIIASTGCRALLIFQNIGCSIILIIYLEGPFVSWVHLNNNTTSTNKIHKNEIIQRKQTKFIGIKKFNILTFVSLIRASGISSSSSFALFEELSIDASVTRILSEFSLCSLLLFVRIFWLLVDLVIDEVTAA